MAEQPWIKRYAEGIAIGVIASMVFVGVGILADRHSPFFRPLFYALVAAFMAAICSIAVIILRRAPRSRVVPSPKNIESCVRAWLDNHKIAVKNDPHQDSYFRLRITLDGGEHLTVLRSKLDYPDYVQILADLGMRGEDKRVLELFSENEKNEILFDLKLELARAKVGYSGLVDPPENFQVFRRVPIYPTLTEFAFVSMIGDVEAGIHLVFIVWLKAKLKRDELIGTARPASAVPKLEPPVA
jgi:hypothetical protein